MTMLVLPTCLFAGIKNAKAASEEKIYINEFMPQLGSNGTSDWVEIYNPNESNVSLEGWYLRDNTSSSKIFEFTSDDDSISGNGYKKVEVGSRLNDIDSISLYRETGVSIDSVSYDKNLTNGSYGRAYDGADEWIVFSVPSPEDQNLVANTIVTPTAIGANKLEDVNFALTITPKASYENVYVKLSSAIEGSQFGNIFENLTVSGVVADNELDSIEVLAGDLVFGTASIININGKIKDTELVGDFIFNAVVVDENLNPISNESEFTISIKDSTAPVITLNGGVDVTVEQGSVYSDLGATALDNIDGDITTEIVTTNNIDTSIIGDYTVIYNVKDAAGNEAAPVVRNVHVVKKTVLAPVVTTSVSDKTIKATWNKVEGATGYRVYLKSKANGAIVAGDLKTDLTADVVEYQNNVAEYGEYYLVVVAIDELGNVSEIPAVEKQTIVNVIAPAPVAVVEEAPVSAVSVAPQKARAAESAPTEQKIEVPSDESGKIKGDEDNQDNDKINWTPWIVLFVLIILAGAATGGYFYWFNGEEEIKPVAKTAKKIEKKPETKKTTKTIKKSSAKKAKRW